MSFPANIWGSSGFPFTGNGFPVKRNKLADAIILALFSNNEQGAYYDPYDLTDEKLAWVANYGIMTSFWDTETVLTTNGTENAFALIQPIFDQDPLIQSDKIYSITYDLSISSGSIRVRVGDLLNTAHTTSGTYTATALGGSNRRMSFQVILANTVCSISNIKVRDLTNFNSDFMAQFPNHTLFQDHLGTIPVTGHMQPVGLVLDKRFGGVRGENLWESGNIVFDGTQSQYTELPSTAPNDLLSSEVFYEGIYLITITNGSCRIRLGDTPSASVNQSGVYRLITRGGTLKRSSIQAMSDNTVATISNIQIQPILGSHASQANSAFRMLWQNNNGIKTFYRDGVDDALSVTLPAATYARIVANTGTGYATNTVVHGGGALNILGSGAGNSAGYILIDRALTPAESADVETLFNKRAGL